MAVSFLAQNSQVLLMRIFRAFFSSRYLDFSTTHPVVSPTIHHSPVILYSGLLTVSYIKIHKPNIINPLNPELNPIRYLLTLLGAHHFLHVSRIRVKLLTHRRLMSYIYMEHPFLMFLDHTQRRSTVGRTPLDE